jgi:hypothetical protein
MRDEAGAGGKVALVGLFVEGSVGGGGGTRVEVEESTAEAEFGGEAEAVAVLGEEPVAGECAAGGAAGGLEVGLPGGGHAACSLKCVSCCCQRARETGSQ